MNFSSLFGAKVINHRVTAVAALRAPVQVCLLGGAASKPALILQNKVDKRA